MSEIKIATWNINSITVRLPHVLDWLQANQPDIVALQETKALDEKFPTNAFKDLGYQVVFSGQKTYNGVAILSKNPMEEILKDIPYLEDPQRRILIATIGDIRVINLYVPNGSEVGSEKYAYKLTWLEKVTAYIREEFSKYSKVLVLGDFNIAPEDADVYDPIGWQGKIHCSDPERQALKTLLDCGFVDSFRLFSQPERSYSWWDYRMLAFRRKQGLRIDLILASKEFSKNCCSCLIDIEPRKLERPSDHAPVIATFNL